MNSETSACDEIIVLEQRATKLNKKETKNYSITGTSLSRSALLAKNRHVKKNLIETEQKQEKTIIELFFNVFMVWLRRALRGSLMFFQLARRAQIQLVELTL